MAILHRSLIQLFRQINPSALHKKHRGRPTEASKTIEHFEYGEVPVKDYLLGAEIVTRQTESDHESCSSDEPLKEEEWESDSDVSSTCSGEWLNMSHSSDEELHETEDLPSKEQKAKLVSQSQILSQTDFHEIESRELSKLVTSAKARKRTALSDELPSLSGIEVIKKRPKHDKESRLATVLEGREGREKFTVHKKRANPQASTTNQEKSRRKAFMMVKHKQKGKQKRSFKEKQVALRNALLKRQKKKK